MIDQIDFDPWQKGRAENQDNFQLLCRFSEICRKLFFVKGCNLKIIRVLITLFGQEKKIAKWVFKRSRICATKSI